MRKYKVAFVLTSLKTNVVNLQISAVLYDVLENLYKASDEYYKHRGFRQSTRTNAIKVVPYRLICENIQLHYLKPLNTNKIKTCCLMFLNFYEHIVSAFVEFCFFFLHQDNKVYLLLIMTFITV